MDKDPAPLCRTRNSPRAGDTASGNGRGFRAGRPGGRLGPRVEAGRRSAVGNLAQSGRHRNPLRHRRRLPPRRPSARPCRRRRLGHLPALPFHRSKGPGRGRRRPPGEIWAPYKRRSGKRGRTIRSWYETRRAPSPGEEKTGATTRERPMGLGPRSRRAGSESARDWRAWRGRSRCLPPGPSRPRRGVTTPAERPKAPHPRRP